MPRAQLCDSFRWLKTYEKYASLIDVDGLTMNGRGGISTGLDMDPPLSTCL